MSMFCGRGLLLLWKSGGKLRCRPPRKDFPYYGSKKERTIQDELQVVFQEGAS